MNQLEVLRLEVSEEVVPNMVVWEKRNGLISYSVPGKIAERVCLEGEKASLWIEMDAGRRIVSVECHYAKMAAKEFDFEALCQSTGSVCVRSFPAEPVVSVHAHRSGVVISIGKAEPDRLIRESRNVAFLVSGRSLVGIFLQPNAAVNSMIM